MLVRHHVGSAAELHALDPPTGDDAELWVCRPTAAALVMGSAQRADSFDGPGLAAAGIDLASRRSGGGAVFIEPTGVVWIDLLAPRTSQWWSHELVEVFVAVGECWQRALAACGIGAQVVRRPGETDAMARRACWAGRGWGEVVVDGVKIVGLSQRRTRWGARVQAMAVLDASADRVADWFADLDGTDTAALRSRIGRLSLPVAPADLEVAVLAELTARGRAGKTQQ